MRPTDGWLAPQAGSLLLLQPTDGRLAPHIGSLLLLQPTDVRSAPHVGSFIDTPLTSTDGQLVPHSSDYRSCKDQKRAP